MGTLIFWISLAILIVTPFIIKKISGKIIGYDIVLDANAYSGDASMTVRIAVRKNTLSRIRAFCWFMFATLAIELIFLQPFVKITPQTTFVFCVAFAFGAYIVEKILQAKISRNSKRSTALIIEAAGEDEPSFPIESHNLIHTNDQLRKWTTGLLIARFVLLTIGATDYFWFM